MKEETPFGKDILDILALCFLDGLGVQGEVVVAFSAMEEVRMRPP